MSLSEGDILGRYVILSRIGAGGMGTVYLAEDENLDRKVALKLMPPDIASDEDRVRRFIQEAKATSALNHPNILTVFDIGEFEGSRYIAAEYIGGRTLSARIRQDPLSLIDALDIALQAASAIGAAHEAGIIHRDIKPENIMIRDDGLVKVLDFGLAKLLSPADVPVGNEKETLLAGSGGVVPDRPKTDPGILMGTVTYMSPEQARGRPLDTRTDIFSFGIVLYELFTGRRPFDGEGHLDQISSILKDDPIPIRQISHDLPRQLERIVDKTLRKDPGHRYQHIKDLEIDLEDLREELKFEAKLNKTSDQNVLAPVTQPAVRPTLTERISTTRRFTLLHAIAFFVIAATLLGLAWTFRSRFGVPLAAGAIRTFEIASWSSAPGEIFANARFSPDSKMIAFASTRSGSKNIWVTQTSSKEAIQVTNDGFADTDPIWSPKGDEIAFFSQRSSPDSGPESSTGIWRVSALGGGMPRSVGPVKDGSASLRLWAESGKVYFQSDGELHSIDVATGTQQKVTSLADRGQRVLWVTISGDERSIAYALGDQTSWTLFTDNIEMSASVEITKGNGPVGGFVWVPAKERFFMSPQVDGVYQMALVEGSGPPRQLTSGESDSVVVEASNDGHSVIISSAKEGSDLWKVSITDRVELPLIRDLNSKLWPAVGPDNEKAVFQSIKNLNRGSNLGQGQIVVMPLHQKTPTGPPAVIAEKGILPSWSPRGNRIAFLRDSGDGLALITVDAAGGGERTLLATGMPMGGYSVSPYNYVQTQAYSWSPDASTIAVVTSKDKIQNIKLVSTGDGTARELTANADAAVSLSCPVWSSDGNRLAFQFSKRAVGGSGGAAGFGVVEVSSATVNLFYESPKPVRLIGWTQDEKGLIFAETEKRFEGLPKETALKRTEVASGSTREIRRLANVYYYNIFLSANRDLIAYAARNNEIDDIWVMPIKGEPRKITQNNDSWIYFSRLALLPDGSSIIFGKQNRFSVLLMSTNID